MKEPWIRVVKKAELGKRETLILRLEAIVLALVAGGFFILLIGQNPFVIYQTIVTGALRSEMAIQATVKIMIPLLIASLGVTLAFKMKFWNIGAEGQIIMGGIFASYFALFHANWNHWLLVIVMFLAGAIGGGLWLLSHHFTKGCLSHATYIIRVIVVDFLIHLLTSYFDLLCVYYDYIIAAIHVRCEDRFVLAS